MDGMFDSVTNVTMRSSTISQSVEGGSGDISMEMMMMQKESYLYVWIFLCNLLLQLSQPQPALNLAVSHILSHLNSVIFFFKLSKFFGF